MGKKQATYQAEWSLLMSGVAQARLEMHRIRHQLHRARQLVEASEQKDAIYEVAGDILQVVPRRWSKLESLLDRTAYALMVLGEGNYRDRLPMDDRALVDDAEHKAKSLMVAHVADRFLESRYQPTRKRRKKRKQDGRTRALQKNYRRKNKRRIKLKQKSRHKIVKNDPRFKAERKRQRSRRAEQVAAYLEAECQG